MALAFHAQSHWILRAVVSPADGMMAGTTAAHVVRGKKEQQHY